jgi:hypothetical protein
MWLEFQDIDPSLELRGSSIGGDLVHLDSHTVVVAAVAGLHVMLMMKGREFRSTIEYGLVTTLDQRNWHPSLSGPSVINMYSLPFGLELCCTSGRSLPLRDHFVER